MSDSIRLNSAKEMKEWMQQNEPPPRKMESYAYDQLMEMDEKQIQSKTEPEDEDCWGVIHALFTGTGWPIVDLGRVYVAGSAEEALQQYLFGPGAHHSGHGEQCVYFLIRHDLHYEYQEIKVFRLAEGTDCFW
jgi:hypothetical protein